MTFQRHRDHLKSCNTVIRILSKAGIHTLDRLIANTTGSWISYPQLSRLTLALSQDDFDIFFLVLSQLVSTDNRLTIGSNQLQLSLRDFYAQITRHDHVHVQAPTAFELSQEQSVPETFRPLLRQISSSSEGKALLSQLVHKFQGDTPPKKKGRKSKRGTSARDMNTGDDSHRWIQNINAVIDSRIVDGSLQYLCTFEPTDSPNTSESLIANINSSTVMRELVRHQAHILVPEHEDYFYKEDYVSTHGESTMRVQGLLPNGKLDCVMVKGGKDSEIGVEIEDGVAFIGRHGGRYGIKSMIKHVTLKDACKRGSEWVPAEAHGVDKTSLEIHPVIWNHLVSEGMHTLF